MCMNVSNMLNHSTAAATIKVVSGSASVPRELKYRYGIGEPTLDLPPLKKCERCHKDIECIDVPISDDWYVLCAQCEQFIRNLVKKEVYK